NWRVDGSLMRAESDLDDAAPHYDVVVLLQPHTEIDLTTLTERAPLLFDTRGVVAGGDTVERL
ncbi:nucleotide sugar dehydrogenase, partial [Georgenia sp. MJ206]